MHDLVGAAVSVALAIVGVAALAVIVSRNSNTSGVIQAASQGYSGALSTALSPVLSGGPSGGYGGGFGGAAPIVF